MKLVLLPTDLRSGSQHDFDQTQSIDPNEEASREFRQVRPNERPLEWRRLLVDTAKQTADDANNQTR